MPIETKTRQALTEYFVKNAIPTEAQFKELIDAQVNQADDGVFRSSMNEPLSVVAANDPKKHVLRFYGQYRAPQPEWLINLAPGNNIAGLSISDAAGNSRLFIDKASGRVGIGTITPSAALTVDNGNLRVQGGRYRRLEIVSDTYWAGIELVAREQGKDVDPKNAGNPHIDFTHGDLDAPNFGVRMFASDNRSLHLQSMDAEGAALAVHGTLSVDKSIGIGTSAPVGPLDVRVAGAGSWNRFVVNTTNNWGDDNAQYVTIGAGGAAGIMLYNPHVVWLGDRASTRYGRSGGVKTGHYWDVGVRANNAFSLAQNGGTHRLWIDGDGNVAIGATDPAGVLDVRVAGAGGWNRFVVNTTTNWGDDNAQYVTIGAGGAAGIMFYNPHVVWMGDRASIRYGRSGGVKTGHWWDVGVRADNAFSLAQNGGSHRLWLTGDGKIGINTTTPSDMLTLQNGDLTLQGGRYRRVKIISDQYWAGIEIVAREQGESGNPHIDFTHGELDSPNYGIRVAAVTNQRLDISTQSGNAELRVHGEVVARAFKTAIYRTATTHAVSLSNSNGWQDFPTLSLTFTLPVNSTVFIFYNITMGGSGQHLVTRLIADGSEQSRTITGDTTYWSNQDLCMTQLAAGSRTVKVQYRTPAGGSNNPGFDWHTRSLTVVVLGTAT